MLIAFCVNSSQNHDGATVICELFLLSIVHINSSPDTHAYALYRLLLFHLNVIVRNGIYLCDVYFFIQTLSQNGCSAFVVQTTL